MPTSRRRFVKMAAGAIVATGAALATMRRARADAPPPLRAHFGAADLFVPSHFKASGASFDLVLHQHGVFVPDRSVLAKYASFAELAKKKEKLFALTHSAVRAPGYASTTECASALLDMAGVAKVPVTAQRGLLGAREIYEAHANDFHVMGFAGGGVEEHRDHARRMDETLL